MVKVSAFSGGIHPVYYKELTSDKAIAEAPIPEVLVFPLCQHVGVACQPLVQVGDRVLRGQKLADSDKGVCAPIHASVSGKVLSIESRRGPCGLVKQCLIIENDGLDEAVEPLITDGDINNISTEEIIQLVREAGIVGMGGADFPTHLKLRPPENTKVDTVILNGAECEPYLTCDHRIMVELSDQVVLGHRLLMRAVGATRGFIGIEKNKPDAIAAMTQATAEHPEITVVPLPVRYPQGGERMLIKAITGREWPRGRLPAEIGIIVNNVGTAAAVGDAFRYGTPLLERVITVTGSIVERPQNLRVRLGTPFNFLLEHCGLKEEPGKVISGGPMMGVAQSDLNVPVTKTVSSIVAFSAMEAAPLEPTACIRCGRCVDACPLKLEPVFLLRYAERGMWAEAKAHNILDCTECGSCSYVCPARLPLVQNIRLAKNAVFAQR